MVYNIGIINISNEYDFTDLPTLWLQQELIVINRILAKSSYFSPEEHMQGQYSEFLNYPIIPSSGSFYMDDVLARLSEIFKKLERFSLINDVSYGEPEMQRTSIFFFPELGNLRVYKTALIKELQIRDPSFKGTSRDTLKNGKLTYSIDNHEVKYDENTAMSLSPSSDYGSLLILLMSNVDKRFSYTEICEAVHIDYKSENSNPEKDESIKRQIQQIKKDLLSRLKKAGVPKNELENLIVSRDGYKMSKIN